jgi:hypothetical protein
MKSNEIRNGVNQISLSEERNFTGDALLTRHGKNQKEGTNRGHEHLKWGLSEITIQNLGFIPPPTKP